MSPKKGRCLGSEIYFVDEGAADLREDDDALDAERRAARIAVRMHLR